MNIKYTIYLPRSILTHINLHLQNNPQHKFQYYNEEIGMEFLWQIQKHTHYMNWDTPDYWVELNAQILRSINRDYSKYLRFFINAGIIECNKSYMVGSYCKSYRFKVEYYNEPVYYYHLTNKCVIKSREKRFGRLFQNTTPETKQRYKHLISVDINKEKALDWIDKQKWDDARKEAIKYNIEKMYNKQMYLVKDRFGREHSNLTNIPKWIRNNCITINKSNIKEIDIPRSQPTFLYKWLLDKNVKNTEMNKYYELITAVKGEGIYSQFQKWWKEEYDEEITRDEAKKLVFKVFYDKCRSQPKKQTKTNWYYQQLFYKHFPLIFTTITNYKQENGYRSLAQELQKIEADYVFGQCKQIECPYFTIHDAVYLPINFNYNIFNNLYNYIIYNYNII